MANGAQNAATQNGFTDSDGGAGCSVAPSVASAVNCQSRAATGPHAANTNYIEANRHVIQPTYFMKIFGSQQPIVARAVCDEWSGGANSTCLYTLVATSAIRGYRRHRKCQDNCAQIGISDNGNLDTTGTLYDPGPVISVRDLYRESLWSPDVQCMDAPAPNYVCPSLSGAPGTMDPMKK